MEMENYDMENYDPNDPERIYRECAELLSGEDFIMEEAVIPVLKRFFTINGSQEDAVRLLSENYEANAQMANLLSEWLLMADATLKEVTDTVEEKVKDMIIRNFDVKRADSLFSHNFRYTPEWLTQMVQIKVWRELIFKLVEKYPECTMLNYVIRIISDKGFQNEITSVSTASQQFGVFMNILKEMTRQFIMGGQSEIESKKKKEEFAKLVSHHEHNFLWSQAWFRHLYLESKGSCCQYKRLFQEIFAYVHQNGHDATPMMLASIGMTKHPRLAQAFSSMLTKNALNPADITTLYKIYMEDEPPVVEFLRIPQFLDLLLDALFRPGSKLHSEQRPKYVYLMAYASSVHEVYKKNSAPHNNVESRKSINKDDLKSSIQAIEKVSLICAERKGSSEILPELNVIFQLIQKYQVIAYGIVYWVTHIVSEQSYFKLNTEQTPLHLALLDEVTSCHSTLHKVVLDLYIDIFEKQYDELEVLAQLELKKMILDRMIHLMSKDCVIPVLKYIKKCVEKGDTDISLIRYFVTEVLYMIMPEYSAEFIELFLPMVQSEEVTGNMRSEQETIMVNEFIEACKPKDFNED